MRKRARAKIGLVALGCAKNTVDLQVMAGHLIEAGYVLANEDAADAVIVNTCAFIASAREEAAAEILQACARKERGELKAVLVAGCFAQRYGARAAEAFPAVDAWVGIDELDRIADLVAAALARPVRARCLHVRPPVRVFDPPVPALRFNPPTFAYLKIAEGCVHRCAYCAIPGIRGRYRSRAPGALVKEARALLKTGARELNVIAQDPMLYGVDFKDGTTLVTLLRKLDKLPGEFWIRVLYAYPSEITDEFLDWMRTSPHAAKYLDVPVQHTDPAILKAMARGAAAEATRTAAARLRAAVPGITLRTTVMTGFPGETPVRFARLLADVRAMAFDHLGAFAFSPEEGTPAATLPNRPSARTAERRRAEVMAVQRRVATARARKLTGTVQRALVVAPRLARLESQAPDVDGVTHLDADAPVGTFVDVRIVARRGYDFVASPVATCVRDGKGIK